MSLTIENDRLKRNGKPVTFRQAKAHSGSMAAPPQVIVLHYGAGTQEGDIRTLTGAYVSAHFSVGIGGRIVQLLPVDMVAWHVGDGHLAVPYNGRTLNYTAVGIEIENLGWLNRSDATHAWREESGRETPRVPIEDCIGPLPHPLRGGRPFFWPVYPDGQLAAVIEMIGALKDAYPSIAHLVGHDEVSRRKFDPGPAFADLDVWRAVFGMKGADA